MQNNAYSFYIKLIKNLTYFHFIQTLNFYEKLPSYKREFRIRLF